MRFDVVTLFPDLVRALSTEALIKNALKSKRIVLESTNPRDFATDVHRTVDDTPYGGGSGMVMKPDPIIAAIEHADPSHEAYRILLSPRGMRLNQVHVAELVKMPRLLLICGRYEGIDQRVSNFVDVELSVGDFVLAGGELAACCVIEAVTRLIPGALGNAESLAEESHDDAALEYPQYTRPRRFRGFQVPDALLTGDHQAIAKWRKNAAKSRTDDYRPDLLVSPEIKDLPPKRGSA